MGIFDLFSKRQRALRGENLDVFIYNRLPQKLRVQIVHIIDDCFGKEKSHSYGDNALARQGYKMVYNILLREYGRFHLIDDASMEAREQLLNYILTSQSIEEVLDVVELCFRYIDVGIRKHPNWDYYVDVQCTPDDALSDLNERFLENAVGYSFVQGEIIKVDSTYIHSEVTKPTLSLLSSQLFQGANDEYLAAHEHYRHGRNKECLVDCAKAFESTMKIICKEKGWEYKSGNASALIQTCFQNDLVPQFTQNQFTSLQNMLASGIPSIRNNLGGHGQGNELQSVDDNMTRYCLNLTGTNIIFLIERSGI